jgi:hypothetical protein
MPVASACVNESRTGNVFRNSVAARVERDRICEFVSRKLTTGSLIPFKWEIPFPLP